MPNTLAADTDRVERIFFPFMHRRTNELIAARARFAYYTTADTAVSILRSRQFWLRNTTAMNDYREVDHGFDCLNRAYKAKPGQRLRIALDASFPGLSEELEKYFNGWLDTIRHHTYMTCLSEHSDTEDQNGRLSMWRAYGGQAGVALVINGDILFRVNGDALGAYASPVAYLDEHEFEAEFEKVVAGIEEESDYVTSLGREKVRDIVFNMLRFAVLCTKHPGFHEEREWRVVASPAMYPSKLQTQAVEVVRGTPQPVLKINLQNHPDHGVVGLALPDLLDRLIVGPCEFPLVILSAFQRVLEEAGVPEPGKKVVVSGIPLRHP
jgi:hypothetical protein